jgi:glycosyltransferase involved in cell wall biosynthesis
MLIASTGWSMMQYRTVLIDAFAGRGLRVTALADLDAGQAAELRRRGAEPIALPLEPAGMNPAQDLAYLARLAGHLRRVRPDVAHVFNTKPALYGAIAAKLAGVPGIVASITGRGILASGKRRWLSSLVRPLMKIAIAGRTRCIFQNPDDRAWYLEQGLVDPARATLIPGSGVDTEQLRPDPDVPPSARRAFVLASRMLRSKGIEDFVAAARRVKASHPEAEFVLFGGSREDYGSKNPDFIETAWLEALNREGVVAWRGFTPPAQVYSAMQRAAAVVLPSYYPEGVPRTLIEGAAAGAPIITTDTPGCRDLVLPERSGFLVAPRSPDQLARAMTTLLEDPDRIRAMSTASREHAAGFDSRLIIQKTLEVYRDALGRPLEQAG